MVAIPASFRAYMFESGIDVIAEAFRASIVTMAEAQRRADEEHDRYVRSGDDDTEYDEDGVIIHSTAWGLSHEATEVSYAAREVRRAFIMSAFHYWERSARALTGLEGKGDNFPVLKAAAAKLFTLDPRLDELNHLNNVLKHNSPTQAVKLAGVRSDHFFTTPYSTIRDKRVTWALGINNAHVDEAIEIVRSSGPQQPH